MPGARTHAGASSSSVSADYAASGWMGCALRIDLGGEPSIPAHEHEPALVDLVDDAAIAGTQTGVVGRSTDELDPRANRDACANTRREKPGTVGIHGRHIGFVPHNLYPPSAG